MTLGLSSSSRRGYCVLKLRSSILLCHRRTSGDGPSSSFCLSRFPADFLCDHRLLVGHMVLSLRPDGPLEPQEPERPHSPSYRERKRVSHRTDMFRVHASLLGMVRKPATSVTKVRSKYQRGMTSSSVSGMAPSPVLLQPARPPPPGSSPCLPHPPRNPDGGPQAPAEPTPQSQPSCPQDMHRTPRTGLSSSTYPKRNAALPQSQTPCALLPF